MENPFPTFKFNLSETEYQIITNENKKTQKRRIQKIEALRARCAEQQQALNEARRAEAQSRKLMMLLPIILLLIAGLFFYQVYRDLVRGYIDKRTPVSFHRIYFDDFLYWIYIGVQVMVGLQSFFIILSYAKFFIRPYSKNNPSPSMQVMIDHLQYLQAELDKLERQR